MRSKKEEVGGQPSVRSDFGAVASLEGRREETGGDEETNGRGRMESAVPAT